MSGGGAGPIIRNKIAETGGLEGVKEQLGPFKRAKLESILAKNPANWTRTELLFVLSCIKDALEAYEE